MYLKQEDDEMKKVGFTIEFGKTEDEKERGKNFVSGIEALARMTEKRFSDAVHDAGLEFDAYVDALDEISTHTDEGDYETAVELIYLLALLLDEDAKEMLEGVIYPDEEAAKIFLDYFNEYIADGYVVDRLLQESGTDEEPGEIREDFVDSLDDEYCCLRSVMDSREESHGEE